MLEAVKLPARVSNLDTGLADVDRDALPHGAVGMVEQRREMGGGVKVKNQDYQIDYILQYLFFYFSIL